MQRTKCRIFIGIGNFYVAWLNNSLVERLICLGIPAAITEEGTIVVHCVSIGRIHGKGVLVMGLGCLEIPYLLVKVGKTDLHLRIGGVILEGAVKIELGLLGIALTQVLDTQVEAGLGSRLEVRTHFTLGRVLASVSGLGHTAWQRAERCHYDQCTCIHSLSIQWLSI